MTNDDTRPESTRLDSSIRWAALLCATVGFTIYINSLDCRFCFDDLSAITENRDLRPDTPWIELFKNDFWGTPMHVEGSHKSYRPLTVATFRLNYMLHELEPLGYHLVNVLLHGGVCYLYVLLCGVVFGEVWPALIAGLLFAVHPIHTEAVAGLVGRAETLSAVFFLLAIFTYRKTASGKGTHWLALSLLLTTCSVLSKEQGITVIAVCYTIDVFLIQKLDLWSLLSSLATTLTPSKPSASPPRWLRPLILRGVLLGLFTLSIMIARVKIMKAELPVFTNHDNPAVTLATPHRQLHWAYLCFINAWELLNPSFLCADWTMGTIPLINSINDPRNLLTLVTIVSMVTLCVYGISEKAHKCVIVALSLLISPYLPASNLFFPVGFVVAERVLYLPSMGFCMLVAFGASTLTTKTGSKPVKLLTILALSFLLITHSSKTLSRNRDWFSDETLFRVSIRDNPTNGKVYNNLGHEMEKQRNFTFAERLFRKAGEVQPDDVGAFINLGRTLKQLEHFQESEKAYQRAIELMPTGKTFRVAPSHINVYYNLANLIKSDPLRLEEAHRLYQTALSMKPDFIEAHLNKGDILLKMNRTRDAKLSFEKALQYNPRYTDALFNLGTANVQLGERTEAERCYREALELDSHHQYSMLSLALLIKDDKEKKRKEEAEALLHRVLQVEPSNSRASFHLALIYVDLQQIEKSELWFKRTLTLDPGYRSALYNLGLLYNHLQRYEEAIEVLTKFVVLQPEHASGAQVLGDCFMRLGQRKKAEEMYEAVLRRHPNHTIALHNLGVAKAEGGNFTEAIRLFSRTIQLDPTHDTARKHLEQAKLQLSTSATTATTTKTTTTTNKRIVDKGKR